MYKREAKSRKLSVRVGEETYGALMEKAAPYKNLSECLRDILVSDMPARNRDIARALRDAQYEIHKIGVNINQITRNNNSGLYSIADRESLSSQMRRIEKLEAELVKTLRKNQT